ncbi:hypothetical protein PNOK_0462300 [Pyrrhoderma noxium]|uniref:Uncharacterized protein n=1 Tax=Pyrrhoderma noxium TaxID=2282107 RepID=A0A286UJK0_9AGAM|nr:hypothetical protein PNOK_0462300 [Pyrrhoderma noxium]
MNPSDPDGGPSSSYRRIKRPLFHDSALPIERFSPISAFEDTIILASKSGATPCYRCVISYRDCPYCDHYCTHYIRQKQACFIAESHPNKVLLANYAILLMKWHDKFDPKKHPSIPDAGLSAPHTSVPPIKLCPCLGKKHVIDDTSASPSPGLDSSTKIASPPPVSHGLKPGSYGPLSKAILEVPKSSVIDQIDFDAEADNLITFDDANLRGNTLLVELPPPSPVAPFSLFSVLKNPTLSPPVIPTVAVALALPTALIPSSAPAPSEPSLDMSIAIPNDTLIRAGKTPLEPTTMNTVPLVIPSNASADPIPPTVPPHFDSPLLLGPLEGASSSESTTLGPNPDSPLTVKPTKLNLTTLVVAPILPSEGGPTLHRASAIPALVHRVRSVLLGHRPSAPPSLFFLAFSSHLPPGLAMSPTLGESPSYRPYLRDPSPTSLNTIWSRIEQEYQEQIEYLLDTWAHLYCAQAATDNYLDQAIQQLDAWRAHFSQLLADAEAATSASLPAKPSHKSS